MKYKKCCLGTVDWERLLSNGSSHEIATRLTVRGKNIAFANRLSEILQLDELPHKASWLDIKRAMSPLAVRQIYESVATLWPSAEDLDRVLMSQQERQSALYVGNYHLPSLARAIARHSLYSDTILVVDPVRHPMSLRGRYNPIINPAEHRANTLVALRNWWILFPWIEADIVRVIHLPGDFDPAIALGCYESAKARADASPELTALLKTESEGMVKEFDEYRMHIELSVPDDDIRRRLRENKPDVTDLELSEVLAEVQRRRDAHPFFVEPLPESGESGEFLSFGVGANYDMAKLVAARTGAHLVTDQQYRWKEIELDRDLSGVDPGRWMPFAKALQSAPLRFLDTADLELAQRLRSDSRLSELRHFFRRVWNDIAGENAFSDAMAIDLAAELDDRVAEAEEAWESLDHELLKWLTGEGIAAAGVVIAGQASIVPAALGFAGAAATNVIYSAVKRHSFVAHHPAAFFIGRR